MPVNAVYYDRGEQVSRLAIVPNLCTAANLLLGVVALVNIFNHNLQMGAVFIILAALMDRIDGFLARRYKAASAFGKEFDSLADMVSFGIAPGALMYVALAEAWSPAGMFCLCLFVLCGGLRLARYNITSATDYFQGVPITFCGAVLAVIALLVPNQTVVLAVSCVLSLAMISNIRLPRI